MKKLVFICLIIVLICHLFGCGTAATPVPSGSPAASGQVSSAATELTIFAAASLTEPLKEIIEAYKAIAPDVKITASFGASGTLQTQIENGAPSDIFFSAATKQMDALDAQGLIISSSKVDLLKNEIVLVVPKEQPVNVGSFYDVATDVVRKIALGEVKSVPAGQYALETFTFLNLWDKISKKAVYGSDVKQVLSWVESGDADCGIVYKTDTISSSNVKVVAEAPNGSHDAVVYPVAVVKASTNQDAAAAFIIYLQSVNGLGVFTEYGFLAN